MTDFSLQVRIDGAPAFQGGHPVVRYVACPSFRARSAALWRLSEQEAVLMVGEPPAEGTSVLLELPRPGEALPYTRLGRVASVRARGEKGYVLRCHLR